MRQLVFIAIIAGCHLIAGVSRGHCKGIFDVYLNRPNLLDHDSLPERLQKWLKTVSLKPGSSLPSVLEQLKEAHAKEKEPLQRDYYAFLISLATADADNVCQRHLFDLFLAIYKQIDESKLSELVVFMDYYGREKFSTCMDR